MGKDVPADLPPRPDARPALHKTAAVTPATATPATPPDASPNPTESP
jgi:hypothetical protein